MLETLRSQEEAETDPALAPLAEALKEDPGLARRRDRILAWDARISEVMRDVAAPAGLAEQILRRLEPADASPIAARPHSPRRARRRFTIAVAVCASVAAVVVTAILLGRTPVLGEGELRSIAERQFLASREVGPTGELTANSGAPSGFPFSPDLVKASGMRWRNGPAFGRAKSVAYDIPLVGGRKATIFVVQCRCNSLPASPPFPPLIRSRGIAVGAWQGKGVVYIAVVDGGERAYHALLWSTYHPTT